MNYLKPLSRKTLTLVLASMIAACSNSPDAAKPVVVNGLQKSDVTVDGQKIGEMQVTPIDAAEIEKHRNRLASSGLTPLPTHKDLNATVFRLEGVSDRPQFYVMPRLIVHSGGSFGNLQKDENGDYTVPFNVAIVDGLSKNTNTISMDGTSVEIPPLLRVKDYEELKANIKEVSKTTEPFEVAALPGCPTKIQVNIAGKEMDVTPANIGDADYCEINRPFVVSLKLKENQLDSMLNDALRNSLVDIDVKYAIVAPIPLSEVHVNFSKRKLFEAIKFKLSANYPPYAQLDVQSAIQSVLKESELNVYIRGDYTSQMQGVVDRAISQFFVQPPPNPDVELDQKCKSIGCIQYKEEKISDEEVFAVNWVHMDKQNIQRTVSFGSKLRRADDIVSFTGIDPTRPETLKSEPFTNVVKNRITNPNNVFNASFLPRYGSHIIVNPTVFQWENRASESEIVLNQSNWDDCTGRDSWGRCSYTTRTAKTFSKTRTGENVWDTVLNPDGKVAQLRSGIVVVVEFANSRIVQCPLANMVTDYTAKGAEIVIQDVEGCETFKHGKIIRYGLINNLRMDAMKYTAGTRYHNGKDQEKNEYYEASYVPEIRLGVQQTLISTTVTSVAPSSAR
ncbi:hypothetical protein [Bdellovibrio sp. HCB209]|uniref:hypothetical protein n=1 Tax=Bdellovibrio sp. HCB209 TaxID=3394354 RepID=UPI0039B44756